jgi:crotonobetainyl-CoA:carnitine CoA-transferase CaiB-like acyl-CoA transferase
MSNEERMIHSALQSWNQVLTRLDQRLLDLTDEQLERQIAPERNRLIYLLGHLTVAHDKMRVLLRVGDRLHSEFDRAFFDNPDRSEKHQFRSSDIKSAWTEVNRDLTAAMSKFSNDEWLERHAAVAEADFAQDMTRNRLAILLSRTNHASFHLGQIVLVK